MHQSGIVLQLHTDAGVRKSLLLIISNSSCFCFLSSGTSNKVKTTLPAHTDAETVSALPNTKPCMIDMDITHIGNINSNGYSTTISAAITALNETTGTTARESTTLVPRDGKPVATFGDTTATAWVTTHANEHEGTTAGGTDVTHTTVPSTSYTTTQNASGTIHNFTASEQSPSPTFMTALSPGCASSTNGTQSVDTGNFTSLSPEISTHAILRKSSMPEVTTHDTKTGDPGDTAHQNHSSYGNTSGK